MIILTTGNHFNSCHILISNQEVLILVSRPNNGGKIPAELEDTFNCSSGHLFYSNIKFYLYYVVVSNTVQINYIG